MFCEGGCVAVGEILLGDDVFDPLDGGGDTSCPVAAFTTAPEGVVKYWVGAGAAEGEV
jgi:hypothetical protein